MFTANAIKLRGVDATDLAVFRAGSLDLSKEGAAPEVPISSLLPDPAEQDHEKRRIINVARPLPATAGVQGERLTTAVHTHRRSSLPSAATHPLLLPRLPV